MKVIPHTRIILSEKTCVRLSPSKYLLVIIFLVENIVDAQVHSAIFIPSEMLEIFSLKIILVAVKVWKIGGRILMVEIIYSWTTMYKNRCCQRHEFIHS